MGLRRCQAGPEEDVGNWHGLGGVGDCEVGFERAESGTGTRAKGNMPACIVKRHEWNLGYCQSGKSSRRREGLGLGFTNKG